MVNLTKTLELLSLARTHEDESGSKPVVYLVKVQVKLTESHWLSHEVTLVTGDKSLFVVAVLLLLEKRGQVAHHECCS